MHILEIIKKPIVSEKTYKSIEKGIYTFRVDKRATKDQIKKSFELIFGVKVAKINTAIYKSKKKRIGKYVGKTSSYKKATITLKEGENLQIFKDQEETKDSKKHQKNKGGIFESFKKSFNDWTTKTVDKEIIENEPEEE